MTVFLTRDEAIELSRALLDDAERLSLKSDQFNGQIGPIRVAGTHMLDEWPPPTSPLRRPGGRPRVI